MAWYDRQKFTLKSRLAEPETVEDSTWARCKECSNLVSEGELESNSYVCPHCDYHFSISAVKRLTMFLDDDTIDEIDAEIASVDFLKFADARESYGDKLKKTEAKTGHHDSMISATGKLESRPVVVGAMEFAFLGGSMGSVTGEKIDRLCTMSLDTKAPLIMFSCSGGARMHEGTTSLMQMAKTCASLARLRTERLPYISIMTNPTTGGVTASFASVGDINLAEPKALIGFAGPRVIEQTIRQRLPEGFQSSEFLVEHGFLDAVVHRSQMRQTVSQLLSLLVD